MIEIKIPKEIRKYKEKLFFGLTLRQFIWTAVVLCLNVPLYFYGRKYVGDDIAGWGVILVAFPIFLIGFFEYNGMSFEDFMLAFIKQEFINPQKRIYQAENNIEEIFDYIKEENTKTKGKKKGGK